jgi:hypothetical protein
MILPEIRSNEPEKRGFIISFPKFSPIEIAQHEYGDTEAQCRSHQQARNIESYQEEDGHEKQAKPPPQDSVPLKKQIAGAPRPKPNRSLQLILVEGI